MAVKDPSDATLLRGAARLTPLVSEIAISCRTRDAQHTQSYPAWAMRSPLKRSVVLIGLSRKIYDIKRRSYSQPPEERISVSGKEICSTLRQSPSDKFSSQQYKQEACNMPLLVSSKDPDDKLTVPQTKT